MDSKQERTETAESEQDEENVYEVEKITAHRLEKGVTLYRVRWKNYASEDDTWEPEEHLESCKEMVMSYRKSVPESRKEVECARVIGSSAGQTIGHQTPEPHVGTQEERVTRPSQGSHKDTAQQKLPLKSDLFDADSESDGEKDKHDTLSLKKKKKKKKIKEDVEEQSFEAFRKDKKKKRRKEKEHWAPLPAPESDGNEGEEADSDHVPTHIPKKSSQSKKSLLESEEINEELTVAPKRQVKEKPKDEGKHKECKAEGKKKTKRKNLHSILNSTEEEGDEKDQAVMEDNLSEGLPEVATMQTDDTTAHETLEPSEKTSSALVKVSEKLPAVDGKDTAASKAKHKKRKGDCLKLQGFKDFLQKNKKPQEAIPSHQDATPSPRDGSLLQRKSIVNARSKATLEDDLGLLSSDSSDTVVSVRRKSKNKGQEGRAQKLPMSIKSKEADDSRSEEGAKKPKEKDQPEKDPPISTNLFEKFLLNCEAKDRVPRRQNFHTPASMVETRIDQTKSGAVKSSGKVDKKTKSTKESPARKPEPEKVEKNRKDSHSPEGPQLEQSPAAHEMEEMPLRASECPPERREKAEAQGEMNSGGSQPREKKGRSEEGHAELSEKKSTETVLSESVEEVSASGKWKERKRRREDSETRLLVTCEDGRDTAGYTDKMQADRGHASISLGMDLKLDWMTLEDFQKHLNGEDEVLSVTALSPGELRDAVKSGTYLAVKLALSSKEEYNLDQEDSSGMSLTMLAAAGGQDDILRLLIKKGARLNSRQKNGSTALMHAAEKNFLTTVAILLEAGAHVNAQTLNGETALMKACKRGNAEIVRLLLEYGADCNIMSKHQTNALQLAKLSNNVLLCDYIKEHMNTLSRVADETIRAYFETRLAILEPIFPLACHRLCEGPDFSLEFNYKAPPHSPEGSGILLFIFHANFLTEISARLCGPCSVHAVVLNDKFQLPIFLDSHFIYSFSPVQGLNKLFIRLAESPTAKVKLLICAYRVQLQ